MTESEYAAAQKAGQIKDVTPAETPADPASTSDLPDDFTAVIARLRQIKQHIETAPTLVPKSSLDQIQFYDDGSEQRIYVWDNNTWRYIKLGAPSAVGFNSKMSWYLSLNQTITAGPSAILFDTKNFDELSEYNYLTGTFTAQAEGYYLITAHVNFAASAANEQKNVYIYKNATVVSSTLQQGNGSGVVSVLATRVIQLDAGDTIAIYAASTVVNRDALGTIDATYLDIHRIS